MRRYPRIVLLAALLAAAPVLAGCENFDPDNWDFLGLNKKKPLPGERHDLFPGGVPGVTQGIPPEYQKAYVEKQKQEEAAAAAAQQQAAAAKVAEEAQKKAAAAEAAEKPNPNPKPKPKPKRKVVHKPKPPTQVTVQPARSQPAQQAPWPDASQPQQSNQAPWPAQQQRQPQDSAWPSAPPAGTFSR
jgi:hypothetical protein